MNKDNFAALLELSSKIDLEVFESKDVDNSNLVATALKNIEALGFMFSEELITKLSSLSKTDLVSLYKELLPALKKMKGGNKRHTALFQDFPNNIMEESGAAEYIKQILLYISDGLPDLSDKANQKKYPLIGNYKFTVIGLAEKGAYANAIYNLMSSKIALSERQREYVEAFITSNKTLELPEITNRENAAFIAGILYNLKSVSSLIGLFKSPTDVLRFLTALSEGDVSLSQNTIFKKMKRSERKMVLKMLDSMSNLSENMVKYKNRWIRLGEILHPGEFSARFPNAYKAFKSLRDNDRIETFTSKAQSLFESKKFVDCAKHLSARPTELARKLDSLLRGEEKKESIVSLFQKVADKVPTNVLLNIRSHFQFRNENKETRIFFPKGSLSKVKVIENKLQPIGEDICGNVVESIDAVLVKRFSEQEKLGKVFISDDLKGINVPFSLRNASESLKTLARGSKVAIDGDKNIIRTFLWWKNGIKNRDGERIDIDLSSLYLNDKFEDIGSTSFSNLRSGNFGVHSGDITDAPNGASEFVDVDIEKAIKAGVRYVAMNVLSFTGQNFSEMEECFAGVMLRKDSKSGEAFEIKTVEHKYSLTADSAVNIPLLFDLEKREMIWVDLTIKRNARWSVTVENNATSSSMVMKGIVELSKPTLYDLFTLHAKGRGEIVKTKEEADVVFDMDYAVNSLPEVLTYL